MEKIHFMMSKSSLNSLIYLLIMQGLKLLVQLVFWFICSLEVDGAVTELLFHILRLSFQMILCMVFVLAEWGC